MNNYIEPEEILKQSEKVQSELNKYLKEKSLEDSLTCFYLGTKMDLANRYEWSRPMFKYQFQCSNITYDKIIPALSMVDLIDFIESKTYGNYTVFELIWNEPNFAYDIKLSLTKTDYKYFNTKENDKLKALLEVAIKLCDE